MSANSMTRATKMRTISYQRNEAERCWAAFHALARVGAWEEAFAMRNRSIEADAAADELLRTF